MIRNLNRKYLLTANNWFFAPDGQQYKSIFGTVTDIYSSGEYIVIGNMNIASNSIYLSGIR